MIGWFYKLVYWWGALAGKDRAIIIIDIIGIGVVFAYTYQARQANLLTRTALRLSEGADLVLEPATLDPQGVVTLAFENTGRRTAITLHGHLEEARIQRPSNRVVQHDQVELYGTREIAPGEDFSPSSYTIPDWKPTESADIDKGTETIIIGGIVTYDDGMGPELKTIKTYKFCIQTFFHLGLQEMKWISCGRTTLDQLMALPTTSHEEVGKENPRDKSNNLR